MMLLPLLLILRLSPPSLCLNQEGLFLLHTKRGIDDPNLSLADWNPRDTTPCNWTGISCSTAIPTVTSVNLSGLGLAGPFPATLCRLRSLSFLTLSFNRFNSSLHPASLLLPCRSLSFLDLHHNCLHGHLPSSLSSLPLLLRLDLSFNNFTGPIPSSFALFPRLKALYLVGNSLGSTIPAFLANLTSLHGIDLSDNPFSHGPIPASLGNLSSLRFLSLRGCGLVGQVPPSLGHLSALTFLDISSNALSGPIPHSLSNLTSVVTFDASMNNLDSPIPVNLFLATRLENLFLNQNQLSGPIPSIVSPCVNLKDLDLSSNALSGPIPHSIVSHCFNLKALDLFSNRLSGAIPVDFGKNSPLTYLELSDNYLSGEIPATLCDNRALEVLSMRNNSLSGSLPGSLGLCRTLNRVRLGNNRLSDEVPTTLWGLPHVHVLELSANSFSGGISPAISGATNLSTLLISDNQFTGSIPEEMGALWNLNEFRAANNRLTGRLPVALGGLSDLVQLDLQNNSLSGELLVGIQSWKQLSLLNLADNEFTGGIPPELADFPMLNCLDLSNNALTGNIPQQLQNLKLNQLNLSNNQLSGPVPPLFASTAYCNSLLGNPSLSRDMRDLCPHWQQVVPNRGRVFAWVLRLSPLLFILALVVGSSWFYRRHWNSIKKLRKSKWTVTLFHKLPFDWNEILDCLDEENVIGRGASGKVYKAELRNGDVVAVKKLRGEPHVDADRVFDEGFEAEVEALGKIRHKNIVKLWCTCTHQDCKLLVYEYMPNGSLGDLLHRGGGGSLDWPMRYKIALDVAVGLSYLHHDCEPPIVHRDIKSSNILVDEEFGGRVADFGIAKAIGEGIRSVTIIMGAIGYIAPEYAYTYRVTEKSDIYSFGIVILELLTGKLPVDPELGEKDLVSWVRSTVGKEGADHMFDGKLDACFTEEMCRVLDIGLICTSRVPNDRPPMRKVVRMLIEAKRESNPEPDESKLNAEEKDHPP